MAAAIAGVTDVAQKTSTEKPKSAIQEQEDRFLKLLVTQMKNQDPLNPLDNAAVTTQMAQISTVQGIEKLNSTLQANTQSQSFQSIGMIGRHVLAPGNFMNMTNGAALAGIDLTTAADSVKVSVIDSNKQVVRHLDLGKLDAGSSVFSWDGKNDAGATLANGTYSFLVTATLAGKKVEGTNLAVAPVDSILMDKSGPRLNVTGMGLVDLTQVRQVM